MAVIKLLVGSEGPDIHSVDFDTEALTLKYTHRTSVGNSTSWLIANKEQTRIYCTDETNTYDGSTDLEKESGAIVVFELNKNNTKKPLTRLQTILSRGAGPTHIHLDANEKQLYSANYNGGSFSSFSINGATGTLTYQGTVILNDPKTVEPGPKKDRQEAAHAHWVGPDELSKGKFVYGVDLGQDKIHQYKVSGAQLVPCSVPFKRSTPGAGPRHIAFHPTKPWAYVTNELDASISAYEQDLDTGALSDELQNISSIPSGVTTAVYPSGIFIDKDGKFVYMTNRGGDNSILCYKIMENGLLEFVQSVDSHGVFPREAGISNDGKWVCAGNQHSSRIDMFSRDPETGKLEWKTSLENIEGAMYVLFLD
jgi:6-phosphogluconolactonase